ncbi:MAG: glycosyltransferase [Dysgonamonadaceae bacterium]|jgi:glycosyltransferase involved in cell wall biosynthesis|nr:glycosyltransferase [Dysgonamonadaceae bacterium]
MTTYSIIIPHKNIPELLERCLKSIPARDDVQVVVVDDNSDAEYQPKLKEIAGQARNDGRNMEFIFDNNENGRCGAGYARNLGLERATGKWLVFADADDCFTQEINVLLDTFARSEEDILFFNAKTAYPDGSPCPSDNEWSFGGKFEPDKEYSEALFRYNFTEPWGKFIKRDLVEQHHIRFEEIAVSNDYWFSIQTGYYAKQVKMVNEFLYVYTVRHDSLTGTGWANTLEKMETRLDCAVRVECFMKQKNIEQHRPILRGLAVYAMKNYPVFFLKKFFKIRKQIRVFKLLFQIFNPVYFNR